MDVKVHCKYCSRVIEYDYTRKQWVHKAGKQDHAAQPKRFSKRIIKK